MAAPEGYSALAKIGFVDRGTYAAATTYNRCDVVYYGGSTYVALKDNLKGVTPSNGANWKYMARGFAAEVLAAIIAVDSSGVLGTAGNSVSAQSLIDAIADKVMTKLILRSKIVDNLLATDPTTVLSGPMGKKLDEKVDSVISDLEKQYGLADTTYVTDFNNASIPGRYRIYNASGSAAHGPYSGAVDGYVDILTDGNINTTGTKVYQTLHDYLGDVYTRVNVAGTSYGAWKKLTP